MTRRYLRHSVMRIDMRGIEQWIEQIVFDLLNTKQRVLEHDVYQSLSVTLRNHRADNHWSAWTALSALKRRNRIRKVLESLVRSHAITIVNESGDPTYSETYTRRIYAVGVLDRLAANLEDAVGQE